MIQEYYESLMMALAEAKEQGDEKEIRRIEEIIDDINKNL